MSPVLLAEFSWEKTAQQVVALLPLLTPLAVGALSLYLLLPRPKPYPTWWGVFTGVIALALGAIYVVGARFESPIIFDKLWHFQYPLINEKMPLFVETLLFYLFALSAIVSGVLLVTQSNPARGALCFTLVILSTCGIFLLLAAPFLMAATIIIYAGAIVVTFLFVLMLASQLGSSDADNRSREPAFAVLTGLVLLAAILYVLNSANATGDKTQNDVASLDAVIEHIHRAHEKPTYAELKKEADGPDPQMEEQVFGQANRALQKLSLYGYSHQMNKQIEDRWSAIIDPSQSSNPERYAEARKVLEDLEKLLVSAKLDLHQRTGLLYLNTETPEDGTPAASETVRTSDLSGAPASLSPSQIRRDDQGRPLMPAENAAAVGKSLFTDYLVPVELGGLLLLIATVGAIAIAYRHQTPGRAP
jgi:NADH:ubiquinone oxidoreductase subunit 6 (subunit J)